MRRWPVSAMCSTWHSNSSGPVSGWLTGLLEPDVVVHRKAGQLGHLLAATAMYAKELRDTPIKVNAANPGYTATDLNGHSGFRSVAEGAEASVHLATLDADGPSGILWGHLWTAAGPHDAHGTLPW
jgi:hypothetical protein